MKMKRQMLKSGERSTVLWEERKEESWTGERSVSLSHRPGVSKVTLQTEEGGCAEEGRAVVTRQNQPEKRVRESLEKECKYL